MNGLTAEEYNARERLRGSIVAKLHGYIPLDYGETEEGLKAQFLALTGEDLPQPRGRTGGQFGGSQGTATTAD